MRSDSPEEPSTRCPPPRAPAPADPVPGRVRSAKTGREISLTGLGVGLRGMVELELGWWAGEDRRHANHPSPPCGTTRT
jgi:hypothetical protein